MQSKCESKHFISYIKIIGIVAKGIVQVNGDDFQAKKAISDQKDDATVRQVATLISQHDKGNGKDVQKQKGTSHLNQGERNGGG